MTEQQTNMGTKTIFLHIPKTGGTSLHSALCKNFSPTQTCPERFDNLNNYSTQSLQSYRFYSGHFTWTSLHLIPGPKQIVTLFREPKKRIISLYNFWRSHTWDTIEKYNLIAPRIAKTTSLLQFLRHKEYSLRIAINNAFTQHIVGAHTTDTEGNIAISENLILDIASDRLNTVTALGFTETLDKDMSFIIRKLGFEPPTETPRLNDFSNLKYSPGLECVPEQFVNEDEENELERLTSLDRKIFEMAKLISCANSPNR